MDIAFCDEFLTAARENCHTSKKTSISEYLFTFFQ
jgi:hypothetical protein